MGAREHRQTALPGEHGAWALYLIPLVIGIAVGGRVAVPTAYLLVATLCAFLLRQPVTMLVKVQSGRRPASYRRRALLWLCVYAVVGALHIGGLVLRGFGHLLWLAVPGVPILAWHLWLIARRRERRQLKMELVAALYLTLSVPAALWVAHGHYVTMGWLLMALVYGFTAWAVTYSYLRLGQRTGEPVKREGRNAVLVGALALILAGLSAILGWIPPLVPLAYLLPLAETYRGLKRRADGLRPRQIGFQLLGVTALYLALFLATWFAPWPR